MVQDLLKFLEQIKVDFGYKHEIWLEVTNYTNFTMKD